MITSGASGLDQNDARLFTASSIWGPWKKLSTPCQVDDEKLTFHAQGAYILPIPGKKDAFIFMADRWLPTPQSMRSMEDIFGYLFNLRKAFLYLNG